MAIWYVRASGNDSHAGSTPSTAWATPQHALQSGGLSAGDFVYVGAGVYRQTIAVAYSGAATATGTNGATSAGGTIFTDSTAAAFTSGMVGQAIEITAGGSTYLCKVTAFTSSSIVTIAPATAMGFPVGVFTGCTWTVGKIAIIGDVDGSQTGDAGQVTLTAYTTNDKTAPSGTTLLAFAAHTYLSCALLTFVGGTAVTISNTAPSGAAALSFLDCTLNGFGGVTHNTMTFISSTTGAALGITMDRCTVVANGNGDTAIAFTLTTTTSGAADWDALCIIRNSMVWSIGGDAVSVQAGGTNTFKGGGVRVYNCGLIGTTAFQCVTASQLSTSVPCEVHTSFVAGNTGLSAATSGQITESYNLINASTPRTNVTAGTGSVSNGSYAPLVELGQSFKWGAGTIRQFLAPDGPGSPLLGFGSDGSANDPVMDFQGRPRPSGGGSALTAVGYAEFHDASVQNTSTVPSGQTSAGQLTGPGDQDLLIPVDATATTIALQLYQGSGYSGSAYATATLLSEGELGIASQVETCTSTLSAWQTLTFNSITASKQGWVRVRITSYDTSGTGALLYGALT